MSRLTTLRFLTLLWPSSNKQDGIGKYIKLMPVLLISVTGKAAQCCNHQTVVRTSTVDRSMPEVATTIEQLSASAETILYQIVYMSSII